MIIGISHITVNSTNLDQDIEQYQANGWHLEFVEKNILNHPAKKPFLNKYRPTHAIALLSKNGNNNIELIQHNEIFFSNISCYENDKINLYNWQDSLKFWSDGLGFELINHKLVKNAPLPSMQGEFAAQKSDIPIKPMLDNDGITCIALYSSNINEDEEYLKDNFQCQISDDIELQINKKMLKILLIRGPSGEMIELIEPKK